MMSAIRHVERGPRLAWRKDRQHHGDVRQVGSAGIRIVENRDIARHEVNRRDGRLDRHGHRAEVHRHVVAHGDHSGLAIEDRARIIAPFANVGRKRRTAQRRAHLLGDRMHHTLKDREVDRIG